MAEPVTEDYEKLRRTVAAAVQAHWKAFLAQGVFMMALGLLAVGLPHLSTIAVDIFVGWLLLIGGIIRIPMVLRSRSTLGFLWSLFTGGLAIVLGFALIVQPVQGVLTLTAALVILFIVEGVTAILIALDFRQHLRNWGWTLFSGFVDLVLAFLIWQGWPGTAAWAIGILVGVNMFFLGLSIVMIALAARRLEITGNAQ